MTRRIAVLPPSFLLAALLAGSGAMAHAPQPSAPPAGPEQRLLHTISDAVREDALQATLVKLVGFGTRHTLSDTRSKTRGIGAARRWMFAEFQRISRECGGCLEVRYVGEVVPGDSTTRIKQPVNVVNVVAVQRGRVEPNRAVLLSGDIDSRVTDVLDATS